MERSKNKQRKKFISRVTIILSISFFLGEIFGLYSISQLTSDIDALLSTVYTGQTMGTKLRMILGFYLPCFLTFFHFRWFIVVPVVLFCRGYLFSCSLAAMSFMNTNDIGNWLGITLSVVLQTVSLIVLSGTLFYFLLTKRKYVFGDITAERQTFLKAVFFSMVSVIICGVCDCLIQH